jgi:hypothetical protein
MLGPFHAESSAGDRWHVLGYTRLGAQPAPRHGGRVICNGGHDPAAQRSRTRYFDRLSSAQVD